MRLALIAAPALLAAAPLQAGAQSVVFDRTGYRLTSIGERVEARAQVVDSRRRPIPNRAITWRIADPMVAVVNQRGVVVSRRPGHTRLWAISGRDSASAIILVEQWAAKFDFTPPAVHLDAVGSRAPLRVHVRDAEGNLVTNGDASGIVGSCRSTDEGIASLTPNREVVARANGATYIRCTDRGIADSVLVQVQQRPVRATIADKAGIASRLVGDTFQIRVRAVDRSGDEVRGARPTWLSLDPAVVNVNPITGLARSVGPGEAKLVAQVGDATDTVTVRVGGGGSMPLLQATPVAAEGTTADAADAQRRLQVQQLFLVEGDTSQVLVTARDAAGVIVSNPELMLRSNDTSVVAVLSSQRIVARRAGTAHLVARFGAFTDSGMVMVRDRANVVAAGTTAEAAEAAARFVRPQYNVDSARVRNAFVLDSVRTAIQASVVGRRSIGRWLSLSVAGSQSSHSSRLGEAGVESRTGILYGGTVDLSPHWRIGFSGDFRTGVLKSDDAKGGEDMTITEAEGDVTLSLATWLALRGGYVQRTHRTETAVSRYNFPRGSLLTRFAFVGGAVSTVTGVSILAGAKYLDGGTDNELDPLSLAGEAGLEVRTSYLNASLLYYVERFTFAAGPNVGRVDQFSAIRLRIGLQVGPRVFLGQ